MKSASTIGITQLLVAVILVSVTFVSFSQTSIYHGLTRLIEIGLQRIMSSPDSYLQVAQILLIVVLAVIALVVSLFGGKTNVKRLCYLSFILFLPSALSFPAVDWLSLIRVNNVLSSSAPFNQTLFSGILLVLCYLLLNYLSRIKETRKELLSRGGIPTEVNLAVNNVIFSTFTVLMTSFLLSVLSATFLMIEQITAINLAKGIPYATLLSGIGSILIVLVLVYYYLQQHNDKLDELPRDTHQVNLSVMKEVESEALDIPVSFESLKTYMKKKFDGLIRLGVEPDLAGQYFEVVVELSMMGIRTIKDLDDIIPNDYIERQSKHLPTVTEKPNLYGILSDLLIIHDAETYFTKVIGNGYVVLQEPDLRFFRNYGVDLSRFMNRIKIHSVGSKKKNAQ